MADACIEFRTLRSCPWKVSHVVFAMGSNDLKDGSSVTKVRNRVKELISVVKRVYGQAQVKHVMTFLNDIEDGLRNCFWCYANSNSTKDKLSERYFIEGQVTDGKFVER